MILAGKCPRPKKRKTVWPAGSIQSQRTVEAGSFQTCPPQISLRGICGIYFTRVVSHSLNEQQLLEDHLVHKDTSSRPTISPGADSILPINPLLKPHPCFPAILCCPVLDHDLMSTTYLRASKTCRLSITSRKWEPFVRKY